MIQAIGRIGQYFYENGACDMEKMLKRLHQIDWQRSSKQWYLRAIRANGRIITSKHAAILIGNVIKNKLEIPLSVQEKAIEQKHIENTMYSIGEQ